MFFTPVIQIILFDQNFPVYDMLKWINFIDFIGVLNFHVDTTDTRIPSPVYSQHQITDVPKSKRFTFTKTLDKVLGASI